MSNYFIKKIYINKVRNVSRTEINLNPKRKKHLIITGRNGSGKTSILLAIYNYLHIFENEGFKHIDLLKRDINNTKRRLSELSKSSPHDTMQDRMQRQMDIPMFKNALNHNVQFLKQINKEVSLAMSYDHDIDTQYQNGNFIIAHFPTNRITNMIVPNGIERIDLTNKISMFNNVGEIFIKYLVHMKTQEIYAKNENDLNVYRKIEKWFSYLENHFKKIFENDNLILKFDYKNYNFLIIEPDKEPYNLNNLSSGFSSILNIVTDLILRMEKNKVNNFDVNGIVLIDEIEVHLHISLQKKILNFLTDFFPNIQFIVTTHSPFIITSIEDAVIFDLHKNEQISNLSMHSYKAIVEDFYEIDQYSYVVKDKMNIYNQLLTEYKKGKLSKKNENKLFELNEELSNTIPKSSEEIKLYKAYLDLQSILRGKKNDPSK